MSSLSAQKSVDRTDARVKLSIAANGALLQQHATASELHDTIRSPTEAIRQSQSQKNDTPMNDTPMNDTPMNDTPMNDTPIYKEMMLLMAQITPLVTKRIPDNAKKHPNFLKIKCAYGKVFCYLMCIIHHKSLTNPQFANIRVCKDTDIEIRTIVGYMAYVFATDADCYASRFNELVGEFSSIILRTETPFEPSISVPALIKWMAIHEDRDTYAGRLLRCIASFGHGTDPLPCDTVKENLEKLRTMCQISVRRVKCILAFIAIITHDTNVVKLIRAALSNDRRTDIVCEDVRTSIANVQHANININKVVNDDLQRCVILTNCGLFYWACCKRVDLADLMDTIASV